MTRGGLGVAVLIVCAVVPVSAQDGQGPGARFGHEMVYDEARHVTLLFGGFGPDGVPKGDTWLWDGREWHLASNTGPSPRKWAAAAYDAERELVVLHGGREGVGRSGDSLDDTWVWDGRAWTEVDVEGPTGRDHHRAVYDRDRERVVMFGGWDGQGVVGDTWEWDGIDWTRVAERGPSPRAPFGLAYQEEWGLVVLVGGQDLDRVYGDVWSWDGVEWERQGGESPPARGFHAMAYSSETGAILIFGGRNEHTYFNDLWSLTREGWALLSEEGPVFRGVYASAFDRVRNQLLIHGGGDMIEDGWRLDSQTWTWTPRSGWVVVAGEPTG